MFRAEPFLRWDSFITTSSPPLSLLVMIVSSFDRSFVKAVLSRRVIFGLMESLHFSTKLRMSIWSPWKAFSVARSLRGGSFLPAVKGQVFAKVLLFDDYLCHFLL